MVKAEFMTHWDGLTSATNSGRRERIMILGATNRMQDIDDAILRRMPKKFPVSLPTASQRLRILGLVLKDTKVDQQRFDLEYVVRIMAGMSGSDIKEACRDAAMAPVRELIRHKRQAGARMDAIQPGEVRGIRTEDFFVRAGSVQQIQESRKQRERPGKEKEEHDWSTDDSASDPPSEILEDAPEEQRT